MNIVERWTGYQPGKQHLFWTAAICVIATIVIGFGPGGWVSGGTARQMADEAASVAHNELAAAVCAEDFLRAANARERLAKLNAVQWWERGDLVAAGGWATMPGEKEADSAVAAMCAERLANPAKA